MKTGVFVPHAGVDPSGPAGRAALQFVTTPWSILWSAGL